LKQRGAPVAANKVLKAIRPFCAGAFGRAVLDRSPADDIPMPTDRRTGLADTRPSDKISTAVIGEPYWRICWHRDIVGRRAIQHSSPDAPAQKGLDGFQNLVGSDWRAALFNRDTTSMMSRLPIS